jgi:hypothetical protein
VEPACACLVTAAPGHPMVGVVGWFRLVQRGGQKPWFRGRSGDQPSTAARRHGSARSCWCARRAGSNSGMPAHRCTGGGGPAADDDGWRWRRSPSRTTVAPFVVAPAGVCAADGGHHSGSARNADYEMPHGGPNQGNPTTNPYGVQTGWRWCGKCELIFWGSGVGSSNCPIGGTHTLSSSTVYDLAWGQIPSTNVYQINWQFCYQCQALYWPGGSKNVHFTNGVCPGTTFPFTGHNTPPGSDYALVIYA